MNKSFDARGYQYVWDSTSLKLAEECPRKYQYIMLDGWQSASKSPHLLFGGWYASALEHFHKHCALGLSPDEAEIEIIREILIETWFHDRDEQGERIEGTGTPWVSEHNTKTRENLVRTCVWYLDQFAEDAMTTVILADGKPAVELSFLLPVDDGLLFSGHIDRLVEYSGDKFVMDQKTTGSTITARYFDGFNPDIQMSMYTLAGKAIYDMPIAGVVIDAAQIAVGFTRFERGFTFRSSDQLDEWYSEMLELIARTQEYTRDNYFPMNRTACGNYGGCQFRDACARSPSMRKNFLAAQYIQGPSWDPSSRR